MRACVDVGGTKVAVSLSPKADAPLVSRLTEPTAKTGDNDALARQIIRLIDQACAEHGVNAADVACVGVSTCGPFVLRDGMVELATPNICGGLAGPDRSAPNRWLTAQLEAPLKQRFGRVRVENDGIAALEAERLWGALQGASHCAYVTWSTGVAARTAMPVTPATASWWTTTAACAAAAMSATSRRWWLAAAWPIASASPRWT
jgi:glucokinase